MPVESAPRLSNKERMSIPRQPMPEQAAAERVCNFTEVALGFDANTAVIEATRCLQCKTPMCVQGCPVNISIPQFIAEVVNGHFLEAAGVIRQTNSLPAVCGRVCPQESQCEKHCIVGKRNEPVAIGRLERFAADYERRNATIDQVARPQITGGRVAIVGSGPAGLSAAGELARLGHEVTVFEAFHRAGGVLVYGIPEFRLPKAIVQEEIDRLQMMGVTVKLNQVIGRSDTVDGLLERGYDAVFVGTGAGLPYFLDIPGESLNGVYSANEFLTRINLMKAWKFPETDTPVHIGERVLVIGGGNTAMDAARTAKRLGPKHVTILYRRSPSEMTARAEEIHHAEEEGIEFVFLAAPTRFLDSGNAWLAGVECIRMELGEPDASGRRRPVPIPGSEYTMEIDTVVIAVGNAPHPLIPQTTPDLEVGRHGNILADEQTGQTNKPGVFAGGDIVSGAATVIEAMGAGRRAAAAIHEYIASRGTMSPQERYERALTLFTGRRAHQRTMQARIELLEDLGVPDAEEFVRLPLPHWPQRVDELLDPASMSMLPVGIGQRHADYVRAAINNLPTAARTRMFRAKLPATGLGTAINNLYREARGDDAGDFEVTDVVLPPESNHEAHITITTAAGDSAFEFRLSRFGGVAEETYAAIARLAGVEQPAVLRHVSPQGEEMLLAEIPTGCSLQELSHDFLQENANWVVASAARHDALSFVMGSILHDGNYVVLPDRHTVVTSDQIEIFHLDDPPGTYTPSVLTFFAAVIPADGGASLAMPDLIAVYRTAFGAQMDSLRTKWDEIAHYLTRHAKGITAYSGMPVDQILAQMRARLDADPCAVLSKTLQPSTSAVEA